MLRDAASFQKNRLACDLGGMRREDRRDRDLPEGDDGILHRESHLFHAPQRSAKRARKRRIIAVQLARAPPALAVVRFGEISEYEIGRERFSDLVGAG